MKRILFVYTRAGAPLEHAFPRIAAVAELHVLAITPLPTTTQSEWRHLTASIVDRSRDELQADALVDAIVERAREIGAEAVMGLSEFTLLAISAAAERLGLRSAGPNIRRSRDKRLMRDTWRAAGVPIPVYRRIDTAEDLHAAFAAMRPPLLLKPAWGAGSVGQTILREESDVAPAWETIANALARIGTQGFSERYDLDAYRNFLVEEIVAGSSEGWYPPDSGYGNYLSVEGLVVDGRYHPICITSRIPTIPPFTELTNNAPCVLPEALQRRIEDVARRSVDSLGLQTCGTHTEIKLCAGGEMVLIESAARFAGMLITKQVEHVFGIEPIGTLAKALLGEEVALPERMLTRGSGAAASVAMIPADASGNAWTTTPVWDSRTVDLRPLVSPASTIEVARGMTLADGTRIPRYEAAMGAGNWAGTFYVTAPDADTLLSDVYRILNGLEALLNAQQAGAELTTAQR